MAYTSTVLITGGTSGLGYHCALAVARQHPNYLIIISSRNDRVHAATTINKTLQQSNTVFLPLDLASPSSVRAYASAFSASSYPPIRALVLNAGLQFPTVLTKSKEGIESTFAVNNVGHALLFHLLWPCLAPDARIVLSGSGTHDPEQKSGMPDAKYSTARALAYPEPDSVTHHNGRQRYSTSKLVNVLWAYALDRRFSALAATANSKTRMIVNVMDPGLMPGTGLAREYDPVSRFVWNHVLPHLIPLLRKIVSENIHSAKESGESLARIVVSQDVEGFSGKYFEGRKEIRSSVDSYNVEKQEDLWGWLVEYLAADEDEKRRFTISV